MGVLSPRQRTEQTTSRLYAVLDALSFVRFALIDYKRARNALFGMRSDNVGALRELDIGLLSGLLQTDGYLYWETKTSCSPKR